MLNIGKLLTQYTIICIIHIFLHFCYCCNCMKNKQSRVFLGLRIKAKLLVKVLCDVTSGGFDLQN